MGGKRLTMLGSKSRTICVKFREDDPDQMEAWKYLQNDRGTKTSGELIADLIKSRGCTVAPRHGSGYEDSQALMDIKHICLDIREAIGRCALSPIAANESGSNTASEKMTYKGEIPSGISDLMRQLSGEDEDE